jgi:hypothetical protein
MNRFGEIADELTDLIEELDQADLAQDGAALKLVLERAFIKACEAERALRRRAEAEPKPAPTAVRARRPAARLAAGGQSGVVIEMPLRWRRAAAGGE